jgi:hypothetical protein
MPVNPVDFISLIKDIRGTQVDPATGLPTNGKWFDVKSWHDSLESAAIDLAAITEAKDSASASANTATNMAAEALASKDAAVASTNIATNKATEATTQRGLASSWAIGEEDVTVSDGVHTGFSAYHWAKKAAQVVGGVTKITDLTDFPTLVGAATKYLRVNATATAIEFDSLTKDDVGLSNADNTSDANKPVSSATLSALAAETIGTY